jgi:hypothetical protein
LALRIGLAKPFLLSAENAEQPLGGGIQEAVPSGPKTTAIVSVFICTHDSYYATADIGIIPFAESSSERTSSMARMGVWKLVLLQYLLQTGKYMLVS